LLRRRRLREWSVQTSLRRNNCSVRRWKLLRRRRLREWSMQTSLRRNNCSVRRW